MSAKSIADVLGASVKDKKGNDVPTEKFSGKDKAVGLYFSAHWCPPCRGFTPKLAEFYNNHKKGANADNMEIIFVSFDRDDASFQEYFDTMPWLSVDFSDKAKREQLGQDFGVSGIPAFHVLDGETGEVITKDGRGMMSSKPDGWPWK